MKHLREMIFMVIPERFELAGQGITVTLHDKITDKEGKPLDGDWCYQTNLIRLALLHEGEPRSLDSIGQTFCHELAHAILDMMSHKMSENESFVDSLGQFFWQFLKSKRCDDEDI